jgi:hypothetical protein
MPLSNAERQKAWRERKKQERLGELMAQGLEQRAQAEPEQTEPAYRQGSAVLKTDHPSSPPPLQSIESYVADAVTAAEIAFSQASPNSNLSTKDLGETLERAEAYARWRYAGVLDGSVLGL